MTKDDLLKQFQKHLTNNHLTRYVDHLNIYKEENSQMWLFAITDISQVGNIFHVKYGTASYYQVFRVEPRGLFKNKLDNL